MHVFRNARQHAPNAHRKEPKHPRCPGVLAAGVPAEAGSPGGAVRAARAPGSGRTQVPACVVRVCWLPMPITIHRRAHSHTQLLQARLQTKREREKRRLTFFPPLVFFFCLFFLRSPPRRLSRGAPAGRPFSGGDYEKQLRSPPSAADSRAEGKKSFCQPRRERTKARRRQSGAE